MGPLGAQPTVPPIPRAISSGGLNPVHVGGKYIRTTIADIPYASETPMLGVRSQPRIVRLWHGSYVKSGGLKVHVLIHTFHSTFRKDDSADCSLDSR